MAITKPYDHIMKILARTYPRAKAVHTKWEIPLNRLGDWWIGASPRPLFGQKGGRWAD